MIYTCTECKKHFEADRKRKFCGIACKRIHLKINPLYHEVKRGKSRTCSECGNIFHSNYSISICSEACRKERVRKNAKKQSERVNSLVRNITCPGCNKKVEVKGLRKYCTNECLRKTNSKKFAQSIAKIVKDYEHETRTMTLEQQLKGINDHDISTRGTVPLPSKKWY